MIDIDRFLKKYNYNKKVKIRFIDKFGNDTTKVYSLGSIKNYSYNCLTISLGKLHELYVDKNTNFLSIRVRVGEMINIFSQKILEINYNE